MLVHILVKRIAISTVLDVEFASPYPLNVLLGKKGPELADFQDTPRIMENSK